MEEREKRKGGERRRDIGEEEMEERKQWREGAE